MARHIDEDGNGRADWADANPYEAPALGDDRPTFTSRDTGDVYERAHPDDFDDFDDVEAITIVDYGAPDNDPVVGEH